MTTKPAPLFRLLRRGAALAAAVVPLLVACGGGTFFEDSTDGQIRLVNASTGATGVDLLESTNGLIGDVAQFTASDYVALESGDYTFNLRSTGTTATAVSTSGSINRGDHYAMVAYTSGGGLAATLLSEEEGDPGSGRAKLRVLNSASTDSGSIDVYLIDGDCSTLGSSNIAAFATDVDGLQDSYTEVLTGSYHVCVTANGDRSDLRLDIPAFTLAEKQIRTLIIARTPGGFLLNGLVLDQQGALTPVLSSSARVRIAVSTTGAAAVDATINDVQIAAQQPSRTVSGYVTVPSGALTATLSVGGTPVTPTGLPTSVAAGADLTLLVTGSGTATLLTDDNTASTSTTNPVKIRLVNGLNGSNPLGLTVNSTLATSGVAFNAASPTKQVAASAGTATIAVTGASPAPPALATQTLESGNAYVVFVLGESADPLAVLAAAR